MMLVEFKLYNQPSVYKIIFYTMLLVYFKLLQVLELLMQLHYHLVLLLEQEQMDSNVQLAYLQVLHLLQLVFIVLFVILKLHIAALKIQQQVYLLALTAKVVM